MKNLTHNNFKRHTRSHNRPQNLNRVLLSSAALIGALQSLPVSAQDSYHVASLEETLVTGYKRTGDYTVITENTEQLIDTAGAMGDPLSAIFALPGVLYSDGQEPAVRGSSPDDNTFVVDFMPASYIFHDFGVSVFSEFILHDFQMYSAGFGPEYSNATGAVFDVTLRDPESKPFTTVIDFSMLRSGLFMESGVTENSAFYVSYRQSMLDLFINADDIDEQDGIKIVELPQDKDYQAKYTWRINDNNKLSLSANGASDYIDAILSEEADFVAANPDFAGDAKIDNTYRGQNLLWEYSGEKGAALKFGLGHLDDSSKLHWGLNNYYVDEHSKRNTVKARVTLPVGDQFFINAGSEYSTVDWDYSYSAVLFVCTEFDPSCELNRTGERVNSKMRLDTTHTTHHLSGVWYPIENLSLELGAQQHSNNYTDERHTLPRMAIDWEIADGTHIKAKAGQYSQFPELEYVLPDTGNPALKSPRSDHFTLGFDHEFNEDWSMTAELYHKTFSDLPLAVATDADNSEQRYTNQTEGKANGLDIMLTKNNNGRWWGWWSLSYGKSERTNQLTGETKDYRLDTPLVANWVLNYQLSENVNVGWRWSVRSGKAYTPITGVQENPWFEDHVLPVYGEAFSERLPLYNRLDLRLQWDTTAFGKDAELIVDILNALDYDNIADRGLDYDKVRTVEDQVVTVDTAEMGIQPALTYRVIF